MKNPDNVKKTARAIAKAIIALDLVDWQARNWQTMQNQVRPMRAKLSTLFSATGYEFANGDGCRVRKQKRLAVNTKNGKLFL